MKPFRFRLERLKRLRNQQLDRERYDLDRACETCDTLDAELRDRAESQRGREAELDARLEEGLSGASLRSEAADAQRGASVVADTRAQLDRANDQRSENRDQLFAAWRRMRLLERLEARGRSKHEREEERRAQRNLDETGQLRWWGRNR
jgi:flagellar export protein FliJ